MVAMKYSGGDLSLAEAAQQLITELSPLTFQPPVSHVYLTTEYTWSSHEQYLNRYCEGKKRVLMLGMNPGPWGMAQTGVPFGEVSKVRDWMGITAEIAKPAREHPKRPIEGFHCQRAEVSGQRLWGLFAEKYPVAADFFADHTVVNYCPLVWMGETGKNITPDKLPKEEMRAVDEASSKHLAAVIARAQPEWLVGIGAYAEKKIKETIKEYFPEEEFKCGKILHPSPASPIANRGWAPQAEKQLKDLGVW